MYCRVPDSGLQRASTWNQTIKMHHGTCPGLLSYCHPPAGQRTYGLLGRHKHTNSPSRGGEYDEAARVSSTIFLCLQPT